MVLLATVDADELFSVLPIILIVIGCTALAILFSRQR